MKAMATAIIPVLLTGPLFGQLFIEPTVGLFQQSVKESEFLAAVPFAGQLISFDDAGLASGMTVGGEWSSLGVTIASPVGTPPWIVESNPFGSAHSQPRFIGVYNYPASIPEDVDFAFSPPLQALSFWLIDSEMNPGSVDRVRFLDAANQPLLDIAMPVNGAFAVELGIQGNFFIGFASTIPIAALQIVEQASDGDGIGIDDLRLIPFGVPTYPGTGEDLLLATSVSAAPLSGVPFDVKSASPGAVLSINFRSPAGTFDGLPYLLLGEAFPTGTPPVGFLPGIQVSFGGFMVLIDGVTPSSIFGPPLLPPAGVNFAVQIPPALSGSSFMLQAFAVPLGPPAINGIFAASDAHEIRIN